MNSVIHVTVDDFYSDMDSVHETDGHHVGYRCPCGDGWSPFSGSWSEARPWNDVTISHHHVKLSQNNVTLSPALFFFNLGWQHCASVGNGDLGRQHCWVGVSQPRVNVTLPGSTGLDKETIISGASCFLSCDLNHTVHHFLILSRRGRWRSLGSRVASCLKIFRETKFINCLKIQDKTKCSKKSKLLPVTHSCTVTLKFTS